MFRPVPHYQKKHKHTAAPPFERISGHVVVAAAAEEYTLDHGCRIVDVQPLPNKHKINGDCYLLAASLITHSESSFK